MYDLACLIFACLFLHRLFVDSELSSSSCCKLYRLRLTVPRNSPFYFNRFLMLTELTLYMMLRMAVADPIFLTSQNYSRYLRKNSINCTTKSASNIVVANITNLGK